MKQKTKIMVALLLLLNFSTSVKAQFVDRIYGAPGEEEVILDIKHISNGETVQVGGIYWNNDPNGDNNDAIITKVSSTGNVIWSRRLSTQFKDRLHRVIVAANGDYIACGYTTGAVVINASGTTINQRRGLICRFNPIGGLIFAHEFAAPITGPHTVDEGPIFLGLCETATGNIAVAGSMTNDRPGGDAVVGLFDNLGNHIWTRAFQRANSDNLRDVIEFNNQLVVCGLIDDGNSSYDGVVIRLNMAGTHMTTMSYSMNYNFSPFLPPNPPIVMSAVWLNSFNIVGGRLFVDGITSNNYIGAVQGENSLSLELAPSFAATARVLSNPGSPFSNTGFFTPISTTEFVIGQNPGNIGSHYSLLQNPAFDYVLTHLNGIATTTESPGILTSGEKTIFCGDVDPVTNMVYTAGLMRNGTVQIGQDDAYNLFNTIPFSNPICQPRAPDVLLSTPAVDTARITWTIFRDSLRLVDSPLITTPQFNLMSPCDSPIVVVDHPCDTCCVDTCYWTLTGNNINGNKNILGTLSNDDIRIFSNNTHRGTIKNNGYWGIQQTAPTTTLDVDCTPPGSVASGLRFENLPQGDGNALVIDANGYVHVAQSHLYKQTGDAPTDPQSQIDELRKEIQELKKILGQPTTSTGNSLGGNALVLSPNPTDGAFNATYNVEKDFSNGEIRIMDASGKTLLTKQLTNGHKSGSVRITLPQGISSEHLICSLFCDGKLIASQKLTLLNN